MSGCLSNCSKLVLWYLFCWHVVWICHLLWLLFSLIDSVLTVLFNSVITQPVCKDYKTYMKIIYLSFKLKVVYGNMHSSTMKILENWLKFNKTAKSMRLISLEIISLARFRKWYKIYFQTFIYNAFRIYLRCHRSSRRNI